jgi:hypothetical protein
MVKSLLLSFVIIAAATFLIRQSLLEQVPAPTTKALLPAPSPPVPVKESVRVVKVTLSPGRKEAIARIEVPEALYKAVVTKNARLLVVGTISYMNQDGKRKNATILNPIELPAQSPQTVGTVKVVDMPIVLVELARDLTVLFTGVTGEVIGEEVKRESAKLLKHPVEPDCIDVRPAVLLDTDNNPRNGIQMDCLVVDIINSRSDKPIEEIIPRCRMRSPTTLDQSQPLPCWWSETNASVCRMTPSHIVLHVERGGAARAPDTITAVSCLTTK